MQEKLNRELQDLRELYDFGREWLEKIEAEVRAQEAEIRRLSALEKNCDEAAALAGRLAALLPPKSGQSPTDPR